VVRALAPFLEGPLGRVFGRPIRRASVFRLMRDPVVLLDGNDRIADLNPAFERRLVGLLQRPVACPDGGPDGSAAGGPDTSVGGPVACPDGGPNGGNADDEDEAQLVRTTGGSLRRIAGGVLGRPVAEVLPDLAFVLDAAGGDAAIPLDGVLDGWAATIETHLGRRGRRLGRTIILRDVRLERARERRLRYQADRDPLTGALNRRAFDALLAQALSDGDGVVTLAFLDLDGFKDINDFYGHATGDAVLIETTARLSRVLRDGDALGRMGGDEFAVALVGLDRAAAAPVVERLRRALEPLHHVHAATIRIEASLGTATAPEDGRDVHALMSAADAAMYRVKSARRGEG